MFPNLEGGVQQRTLSSDDITAISLHYTNMVRLPGCAKDIAVNDSVGWMVGCNDRVYQWSWILGNWVFDASAPHASAITVDGFGRPWVISLASGNPWHKDTTQASSGTWWSHPGCLQDIGAATGVDLHVWGIACNAAGGEGAVSKYTLATNSFVPENLGGAARRVAVDTAGIPWVTNQAGIWRREGTSDPTGAGAYWVLLPGAAVDIGISQNQVWVIGSHLAAPNLFLWNEQVAGANPSEEYRDSRTAGLAAEAGPQRRAGRRRSWRVWYINAAGEIFRESRVESIPF